MFRSGKEGHYRFTIFHRYEISALSFNITETEQYLSLESSMARLTSSSFISNPSKLNCRSILVKYFGCCGARSASILTVIFCRFTLFFFNMEATSIPVHPAKDTSKTSIGAGPLSSPPTSGLASSKKRCPDSVSASNANFPFHDILINTVSPSQIATENIRANYLFHFSDRIIMRSENVVRSAITVNVRRQSRKKCPSFSLIFNLLLLSRNRTAPFKSGVNTQRGQNYPVKN